MRANLNWEKILSSLRAGVTSDEDMEFLEVGRDYEVNEFEKIIVSLKNSDKSVTKFIDGDYGDGKTFFLKVIKEKTYNLNFVVSTVVVNPYNPFYKLDLLYQNILREITSKNGNSFVSIVNRWINSLNRKASNKYPDDLSRQKKFVEEHINDSLDKIKGINPTFVRIIKKFYEFSKGSKSNIAEEGLFWLCGENIENSVKKEFGIQGVIDTSNALNYIKTLSIFFKEIGYSGFVILFDECETIMDYPSGGLQSTYNIIRDIYNRSSRNEFKGTLFVFAGIPSWFEDSQRGIKSNPALYDRIKDPISNSNIRVPQPIIHLGKFNKNDLMKLSRKIFNLYDKVYKNTKTTNKFSPYVVYVVDSYIKTGLIDIASLRDFIKELIGYLDHIRENPDYYKTRGQFLDLIGDEEEDDW